MTNQLDSFWKGQNVFVTGANGFLGSWMCQTLVQKGANVIGLVRDEIPDSYLRLSSTDKKITIVWGELQDYALLERVLNEYEIDSCFHLGAQPIVTIANRFPLSTFDSNIRGTWNLLEALRLNGKVARTIVASSDKAYGSKEKMPYNETDTLDGRNPYDFSKTATDLMSQMYAELYKVPLGVSRCGNFFGPGDLNFSRIVPGTLRSLLRDENPIIRSNGKYLRDYFYIEDVVNAYLTLAENLDQFKGQAFNFGTEQPVSVLDIVDKMIAISGKTNLKPQILATATGEIPVQYLSCEKSRTQLNWKPNFDLDSALKLTYNWYKDFLKN